MKAKSQVYCIACRKPIRGKSRVMRLQIAREDPGMIDSARKMGFTSANWRAGEAMQGTLHRRCFNQAIQVWEIAFNTRALSPRR